MVAVYTTPSCPHCRSAKQFLRQHHVSFREVDVAADAAGAREMMRKSGQMGVPVIDVGGTIIVGFDRIRLLRALGLRA